MSKTVDDGGAAMSEDIVVRLRRIKSVIVSTDGDRDEDCQSYLTVEWALMVADTAGVSADTIEALRGEVEDLGRIAREQNDFHVAARMNLAEITAERDRLKAVLKPRLNAKAIEGLQEILEAMEAMDEREAPFLKTLLDWHEASRKALGDAS